MTSTEFCYWLQGLFELNNPISLNDEQTKMIKDHLNLVFINVTKQTTNVQDEILKNLKDIPNPNIWQDSLTRTICSSGSSTRYC